MLQNGMEKTSPLYLYLCLKQSQKQKIALKNGAVILINNFYKNVNW